jgi:hypothetical protein
VAGGPAPGPIYISSDAGKNWNQAGALQGYWTSAACATDGNKMIAVEGGYAPGNIYTLQLLPPSPTLKIAFSAGHVRLSWPADGANFILQQNSDLGSATTWQDVTDFVSVVEGENQLILPGTSAKAFYRLRSQ